MAHWAKPGVKCVCINGSWPPNSWYGWEFLPREGETYTIRETLEIDGQAGLRLVEIENPRADYAWGFIEPAFAAVRFRPLTAQSDDLAKFTHLLTPQKIEERV
ncbi:hypothetical protein NO932_06500 [Pelagibacterium sp. 26DY04]|uniref:hypothetical protein n=1 Tax=Pelagibacterium sp. 26DY04 TaxID=2967130 RepID=UPI0028156564|nr:hypothetical protein [Pelagibacterium sp. 26DY04]WMT88255.1 hypothetical protein NO932_06500 [Pelagibacterium sp. 26DY04]